VEWCADLGAGSWFKLADLPARLNDHRTEVTDRIADDQARYYRVLTPRQP